MTSGFIESLTEHLLRRKPSSPYSMFKLNFNTIAYYQSLNMKWTESSDEVWQRNLFLCVLYFKSQRDLQRTSNNLS